jgi:hypothetical protein
MSTRVWARQPGRCPDDAVMMEEPAGNEMPDNEEGLR